MESNRRTPLPTGNRWKQPLGVTIAALLVFGAVSAVLAFTPQNAYAAVSITSSSDRIFGSNFVRVLITDSSLLGSPTDEINVNVEARRGSTSLGQDDIQVKEISSSGSFELFITTQSAGAPANPTNTVDGPFIERIHTGGDIQTTLQNGDSIIVTYGGMSKTISFSHTVATIDTDRTVAGTENKITVRVTDQDANNDPTAVDTFPASGIIQALIGSNDVADISTQEFTESGQNTGIFELTFIVDGASDGTTAGIDLTDLELPQGLSFRIQDHRVYEPTTDATQPFDMVEATNNFPSRSVTLQNSDGVISLGQPATISNGLQILVNDADRNIDTQSEDELPLDVVTIDIEGVAGGPYSVEFEETDDDSGIFQPAVTDNRILFQIGAVNGFSGNTFTLTPDTIASDPDITIKYNDPFDANNNQDSPFQLVVSLSTVAGTLSGPSTVGVTNTFSLTIADNDLNTNPNTAESYTVTFPDNTSTADRPIASGAGTITLRVKGSTVTWDTADSTLTLTFIETGPNTGEFVATNIEMNKINAQISGGLKDGDQVRFTYKDNMESPATERDVTITIGKPSSSINADRTTVPLPVGGNSVKVKVTITDVTKNTNTGSTDTFALDQSAITVTRSDGTEMNTNPSALITGLTTKTFTETGLSTGVFEATYTLSTGGSLTISDLNGAKVKFTYGSQSVSITLKAYDGVLTTSTGQIANGVTLNITVSDQDGNRDPETRETLTVTAQGKNDDLPAVTFTLEETGPNTGVFTKSIVVGSDVRISDLQTNSFSTNLELHYTDAVASDSSTDVDRELVLNVGTFTGSVSVMPEIIGPGTKVTILVDDKDLNQNPDGVDSIQPNVEYLRITSDRSGVNTLTTALGEETGPNTGIFETTLTLSPVPAQNFVASQAFAGTSNEVTGKVLPGDIISIRYTDQTDEHGNKRTVSKTFQVVSVDPEMSIDTDAVGAGQTFSLTVVDADANTDGDAVDSVRIRVTSTSDPVGYDVTALETGPNTGVFVATVTTTTSVSAGSITVANGDIISLKYTDKYPADYADRVKNVVDPSKDFVLTVAVGAGTTTDSTTPSTPSVRDSQNNPVSQVLAGQQVVLSSTIKNNDSISRQYTALVEVRDSDNVTVYLQWQSGTLAANGSNNVGVSWTPDAPGTYTVRVFVLSDLTNPQILSPIVTSTVNVS